MPIPDKAQSMLQPNAVHSALAASQRLTLALVGVITEQQRMLTQGHRNRRAGDCGRKTAADCRGADLTGGRYGRRSGDIDVERL